MRAHRAQNMVELALLLPVLALLVAIGIDFARVYHMAVAVNSSSRVAAEFAATHGSSAPLASDVRQTALNDLGSLASGSTVTTSYDLPATPTPGPGQSLTVTVRRTFNPITPLAHSFMPSGREITSTTSLRRNCAQSGSIASCGPVP